VGEAQVRRSHRGVAAVDEQQRAGHLGGVVRGEKQDAGGDFIGRAVTPEQRALGGVIPVLVERPAERFVALLVGAGESRVVSLRQTGASRLRTGGN